MIDSGGVPVEAIDAIAWAIAELHGADRAAMERLGREPSNVCREDARAAVKALLALEATCPTCGGTDEQLADGTYSENGCPTCGGSGSCGPLFTLNTGAGG